MNYSNFSKSDVTFAINRGSGQVVAIKYEGTSHIGFEDWETYVSSDGKRWAFLPTGEARHTTARDQEYIPYHPRRSEGEDVSDGDSSPDATCSTKGTARQGRSNGSLWLCTDSGHVFVAYGRMYYTLTGPQGKVRPKKKRGAHWIHIGSLNGMGSDFAAVYYQKGRKRI